jgi:hypothetical protein
MRGLAPVDSAIPLRLKGSDRLARRYSSARAIKAAPFDVSQIAGAAGVDEDAGEVVVELVIE